MVRDLDSFPLAGAGPVRTFGWRAGQRHRPGLGFMVSTGRLHGFESLEEAKLLLAVDFLGMTEVLVSQPFRLRFSAGGKTVRHTPDVLVRGRAGTWLIDVRPAGRIGDGDVVKFAAAASAAESCGWKYVVVAGWRRQVLTTLDAVSSQRRDLQDPLRLQDLLLARAAAGGRRFGDLVGDCVAPAVARAQLLHLIWLRCLGIDLARPLTDDTLVICAERSV